MTTLVERLRNEGRARNRHLGPNAPKHQCEQAADALETAEKALDGLADEMDGLLPYLASHNWRLDRLYNAVAQGRTALAQIRAQTTSEVK